jgi:phosphatidylserine/phosphatidylglycerophosphate/cardiolipin synthase-like enzyme
MTTRRATLTQVSTAVLEQLRDAIAGGALRPPLDRAALVGFGVRHQLEAIELTLGGHKSAACLAVLDVALAEREDRKPTPELVWTGPEAPAGTARDTAVVLRELFEGARESVVLGGYNFKSAGDLLAPLHRTMRDRGIDARFFVHVPQVVAGNTPEAHLEAHLDGFLAESWPFGAPRPRIYYDKRSLVPGPPYSSMHAKCVVVDGARAFVSSANFTQRAQQRNIEVGVLIEDPSFASFLARQWLRLIEAGITAEYLQGALMKSTDL